jgi:hypothetical protein
VVILAQIDQPGTVQGKVSRPRLLRARCSLPVSLFGAGEVSVGFVDRGKQVLATSPPPRSNTPERRRMDRLRSRGEITGYGVNMHGGKAKAGLTGAELPATFC